MGLRDIVADIKAERADAEADAPAEEEAAEVGNAPASTDSEADTNPVEDTDTEPTDDTSEEEGSVDIEETSKDNAELAAILAGARRTPSVAPEVEAIAASTEELPLVASMKAVRLTKKGQVQYDGTTPEGYVVRVWAPEGTDLVTHVEVFNP